MDIHRLTKFYTGIFFSIIEADSFQEEHFEECVSKGKLREVARIKRSKLSNWQLAKRALVIYLTIKQIILIALQYKYDMILFEIKHFMLANNKAEPIFQSNDNEFSRKIMLMQNKSVEQLS